MVWKIVISTYSMKYKHISLHFLFNKQTHNNQTDNILYNNYGLGWFNWFDLGGTRIVEGVWIGCDGIDCFRGAVFWFVDNLRDDLGGLGRGITDGWDGLDGVLDWDDLRWTIGWEGFGGAIGWGGLGKEETGWEWMTGGWGGCVEVGMTDGVGFGGVTTEREGFGIGVVTGREGITGGFGGSEEVGTIGWIGLDGVITGSEGITGGLGGWEEGEAGDDGSDTARSSGWVTTGFTGCEYIEFSTDGLIGTGGIDWFTITTLLVVMSGILEGFDWVATVSLSSL